MYIKNSLFLLMTLLLISSVTAQSLQRSEIENKYKWDLSHLYSGTDDWKADYEKVSKYLDKMADFKGKLGENSEIFYNAIDSYFGILKSYIKLIQKVFCKILLLKYQW